MKDIFEQFFNRARQERLIKEKKDSIRDSLLIFIKEHPYGEKANLNLFKKIFYSRFKPAYIIMTALIFTVIAGGGVSVSANSALPGDMLYLVKVGFNEPLKMVLAFSDEAKTELAVKLADLRLQEAEKLALQGKMTAEGQNQIAMNFNKQAKKVEDDIKKLNQIEKHDDAARISSDLEASLKAHGRVLENLKQMKNKTANLEALDPLIKQIGDTTEKVSDTGSSFINSQVGKSVAKTTVLGELAESRLQIAEKAIMQSKSFVENKKEKIGEEAIAQAENNLKLAQQYLDKGKEKMNGNNSDMGIAVIFFQQAAVVAKESRNLVDFRTSLGLNMDINVNPNYWSATGGPSLMQEMPNSKNSQRGIQKW